MSVAACAEAVAAADPDRFRAAMAAPVAARAVLFPIYAFLGELSRAPWVTQEPMIAEMRLQWWRDVLEEVAAGGAVRRHDVATALADVLDRPAAEALDACVTARQWDIYRDPFEDSAALVRYLEATGATPAWQAARLLGASVAAEPAIRGYARGAALARYLQAVPDLEALGRRPLVDGRPAAVAALAGEGLAWMSGLRRRALSAVTGAPLIEGWRAAVILRQAAQAPGRVAEGALGVGPLRDSWLLMRSAWIRL